MSGPKSNSTLGAGERVSDIEGAISNRSNRAAWEKRAYEDTITSLE